MRHIKWIDQCGKELALRAEYPTDFHLVAYLDAQSLVRKAQLMLDNSLNDHLDDSSWKKQETEDRLLPCQGLNDNCKSCHPH
jgi:hypothetical protein